MRYTDFLLVITIVLLGSFYTFINTPKGKGWLGELYIKLILGKTKPGKKYVINNLMLKLDESKTSQIDHILIKSNGIFVIETKNYSGRIYGQENQLEWTQVLCYGKVKNKLYNPIKQNKTHIYYVSQIITDIFPIVSAVVFIKGNTKFINAEGVYNLHELHRFIKSGEQVLSPEQMQKAYEALTDANDRSVTFRLHISNIKAMQNNISNDICPRCGKTLAVRHGKKGDFMGCTGYPSCRFTKTT